MVVCNRRRDKLKILYWQRNGFWLWYRRLERGRFHWPRHSAEGAALQISTRELSWLLDGLDIARVEGHGNIVVRVVGGAIVEALSMRISVPLTK